MVNFTAEQFRELMNHPTNIRNMSVIAHVVYPPFKVFPNKAGSRQNNLDRFAFEASWHWLRRAETGTRHSSRREGTRDRKWN
jgi:hypothetical protein